MRMKTKSDKHDGRLSRQQYCNEQSAGNGNRTEESQHGPDPIVPNIGIRSDTRNNSNKRIR
jgi:hypothetical protein